MVRSLYTGVTGLRGFQKGLDNIGNNVANVNTTAYKSTATTFNTLLSQSLTQSSGATNSTASTNSAQVGLGMGLSATTINVTKAGAAQVTGDTMDFRIDGSSFFVISNGNSQYYTRDGSFSVDASGDLVNSNGYYVLGWTSADGETVNTNGAVDHLNIVDTTDTGDTYSAATSYVTLTGKINPNDTSLLNQGYDMTVNVIGGDGQTHKAALHLSATIAEDGTTSYNIYSNGYYDEDGAFVEFTDATPTGASIAFNADGSASDAATTMNINIGATDTISVTLDLSQLSLVSPSSTSIVATKGDSSGLNGGYETGSRSGFSVDTSGKIYATYQNGATRLLGQIAVADFQNPVGLEKIGDNLYGETLNSGTLTLHDVTENNGRIISGQLEMSNVDLATEMSNMIIMQRAFQASSRIITVTDSMLQVTSDLKR